MTTMPAGRPTELTPEVIEDVRRVLPVVLYLETVADYIGVTRFSVRNWLRRGRQEEKRLRRKNARPRPSESLYLQFFNVYKKALADGLFADLGTIKKASADQTGDDGTVHRRGEWQAAAWRAERRFPKLWGRKDRVEHSGGVAVQTVEGVDEDEVLGRKPPLDAGPV